MRALKCFATGVVLTLTLGWTAVTAHAQAYSPVVHMSVTLPDGKVTEVETQESRPGKLMVGDREYALRPTMMDDEGGRIVIAIFDMGSPKEAAKQVGEIEAKVKGPMVTAKMPAIKVRVTEVKKTS